MNDFKKKKKKSSNHIPRSLKPAEHCSEDHSIELDSHMDRSSPNEDLHGELHQQVVVRWSLQEYNYDIARGISQRRRHK